MKETSLGKLQKTVDKQEKQIINLQELVKVRKEKYRLLQLKYNYLEKNIKKTVEREVNSRCETIQKENESLKEEILRLRALLNTDSNNSEIPTSKTPVGKNKRIPNSREKTGRSVGGQAGHEKHKLKKFDDEELTDSCCYEIDKCPCGGKRKNKR